MVTTPHSVHIPTDAVSAIWLRCPTASGAKDWICAQHSSSGVTTFWGRTGYINQSNYNKDGRLINIVPTKTRKGYSEVASWTPQTGWVEPGQAHSAPPEPPKSPKKTVPPEKKKAEKEKAETQLKQLEASIDAPEWF